MAAHRRKRQGWVARVARHLIHHPFRYLLLIIWGECVFIVGWLYDEQLWELKALISSYPAPFGLALVWTVSQFRVALTGRP